MKNKKDTGLDKINNKLLKQVGGHLAELRKLLKEDSRAKYKMLWLKWDATLLRCLKITDLYCMQVADNKIERRENEYLKKELRNYAPEHHLFKDNDFDDNGGSSNDSSTSNPSTESEDSESSFTGLSSFRRGDETIN